VAAVLFVVALDLSTASAKSTLVLKCNDGDSSSLIMVGKEQPPDLVCDIDGTRDGICTFAASCPLCSLATPPCLAPCTAEPLNVWATVPVLRSRVIDFGERTLVFRCNAPVHPKHRR
jgi:hypothetical protein